MASTGAGSSPVFGGSFVSFVVKSIAILSDPIPTIIRWVFLSRSMILLLCSWIGTTLGVIDMHTAWRMLAAHCQSPGSAQSSISRCELLQWKKSRGLHPALQDAVVNEIQVLAAKRVDSLPVALDGLHPQAHLLAQFAAQEAAYAVGLPARGSHDGLQAGARVPLEQRDDLLGLGL